MVEHAVRVELDDARIAIVDFDFDFSTLGRPVFSQTRYRWNIRANISIALTPAAASVFNAFSI
jgi:hypothetical protein